MVPLCPGGLRESRGMSVLSMGGKHSHSHSHIHTHGHTIKNAHARFVGIRIMTLRNNCGVLFFGAAPKVCGYDTNTEAID